MSLILGALVVGCAHLFANMINDVADKNSGVDDIDKRYFAFFGGSKLLPEGRLSIDWYTRAALAAAGLAGIALIILTYRLGRYETPLLFAVVLGLAWQYSCPPLKFAYRGFGELIVFICCGPACLAGGVYLTGGGYPSIGQWLLSFPFGFLTTGILLANEVPDYFEDKASEKRNLVVRLGQEKGWLLFLLIEICGWISIAAIWYLGYLKSIVALATLIAFPLVLWATFILKNNPQQKELLVLSSKLGIAVQTIVSVILIAGEFIN
ncbi:MAG: prenyltransferase [Candidatus Riflebacteria bacterium]|nr:prenyltransferase [Candidatus Riflebacteria bacterium]